MKYFKSTDYAWGLWFCTKTNRKIETELAWGIQTSPTPNPQVQGYKPSNLAANFNLEQKSTLLRRR